MQNAQRKNALIHTTQYYLNESQHFNDSSWPLPALFFPPCTQFLSGHILNMLFRHPIQPRDAEALGKVQTLTVKFVKGLRYVPYEAAPQQLRLFSLTHRRILGECPCSKIIHGLLVFPMESTFTPLTRKGIRAHAHKFHQQRCYTRRRQCAFTIRAVQFWNKPPAEIVNASSVKSFKTLLHPPPPTTDSLRIHWNTQ